MFVDIRLATHLKTRLLPLSSNFLSFPSTICNQAASNSYANPAYEHATVPSVDLYNTQDGPQAPYSAGAGHGGQVDAIVNPVYAVMPVGMASHEEILDC